MATVNAGGAIYPAQFDVAVLTDNSYTNAVTITLIHTASSVSVAQTITWVSASSFLIDEITQGALPFGTITVRIQEGATVENISVVLQPYPGNAFVTVTTPDLTDASVFYNLSVGTVTAGWLIEYDNASNVTFDSDGTYIAASDVVSVNVRLWNDDSPGWADWFNYTLTTTSGDNNYFTDFSAQTAFQFSAESIKELISILNFNAQQSALFSNGGSQALGEQFNSYLSSSFAVEVINITELRPKIKFIIKRDGRIILRNTNGKVFINK